MLRVVMHFSNEAKHINNQGPSGINIADILVSAYGSPTCVDIKTVFKPRKNAWTRDFNWCNYIVCDSLFNN